MPYLGGVDAGMSPLLSTQLKGSNALHGTKAWAAW